MIPDARRLEELGLNSSVPPGQLLYDGWLIRLLRGKAKRARSVNAVYPSRVLDLLDESFDTGDDGAMQVRDRAMLVGRESPRPNRNCHADLATVGRWLQSVYRGWCRYYAVPGNYPRLQQFRDAIQAMWLRVLRLRSQRGRRMTWRKFSKLSKRWLAAPTILHPYPNVRFACQHPR